MSEPTQAPTIEQLAGELHKTRVGLNKAIQQREIIANEVIDLTVSLDESRRTAQAQAVEIGNLRIALRGAEEALAAAKVVVQPQASRVSKRK